MRLKAYSNQTKMLHLCFDIFLKPSRVVFISCSKGKHISLEHRRSSAPLGTIGRHHQARHRQKLQGQNISGIYQKLFFLLFRIFYFPFWLSSDVLLSSVEWPQGPATNLLSSVLIQPTHFCTSRTWVSNRNWLLMELNHQKGLLFLPLLCSSVSKYFNSHITMLSCERIKWLTFNFIGQNNLYHA